MFHANIAIKIANSIGKSNDSFLLLRQCTFSSVKDKILLDMRDYRNASIKFEINCVDIEKQIKSIENIERLIEFHRGLEFEYLRYVSHINCFLYAIHKYIVDIDNYVDNKLKKNKNHIFAQITYKFFLMFRERILATFINDIFTDSKILKHLADLGSNMKEKYEKIQPFIQDTSLIIFDDDIQSVQCYMIRLESLMLCEMNRMSCSDVKYGPGPADLLRQLLVCFGETFCDNVKSLENYSIESQSKKYADDRCTLDLQKKIAEMMRLTAYLQSVIAANKACNPDKLFDFFYHELFRKICEKASAPSENLTISKDINCDGCDVCNEKFAGENVKDILCHLKEYFNNLMKEKGDYKNSDSGYVDMNIGLKNKSQEIYENGYIDMSGSGVRINSVFTTKAVSH